MLPLPFLLPLHGFLSSFSLHLAGPYNFFWPCSCHCVQTLLHAFLSTAFNKSISRALQVLLYKSIIIQHFYTIIGGLSIQVALIGMRNIPLLMDTWIVCRWSLKIFTLTTALLNSGLVDCTSSQSRCSCQLLQTLNIPFLVNIEQHVYLNLYR